MVVEVWASGFAAWVSGLRATTPEALLGLSLDHILVLMGLLLCVGCGLWDSAF